MEAGLFVYDIKAIDEVMLDETNATTTVSIVFSLPTGKLFGIKLGQAQLGQLEETLAAVQLKMRKSQGLQ